MTYDLTETSPESGRPVEIYTWSRGYLTWRDTSADRDVVVDFKTYTSRAMRRSGIEQGSEMNRSALKVTVPRDHPIASMYRITPPSDIIALTIQTYHEGDGEVKAVWSGRILSVSHGVLTSDITLEPVSSSMRRTGLRRVYQRQCPHVLYGNGCGLTANDWRTSLTVTAVSGLTITAPGLNAEADGWWEGGFMRWQIATGIYEHRFIEGHTGNTVTVDLPPLGLEAGTLAEFFPGCEHTIAVCNDKFSNAANYGGTPYSPQKNPFGSDPIF